MRVMRASRNTIRRVTLLLALCAGAGTFAAMSGALSEPEAATSFTVSPPNPAVGQTIQFRDTTAPPATSWNWDFADGTRATIPNPTKSFSEARQYNVSLFTNVGGVANRGIIVSPENTLRFLAEYGFALSGFDVTLHAVDQRTGRAPLERGVLLADGRADGRADECHSFRVRSGTKV